MTKRKKTKSKKIIKKNNKPNVFEKIKKFKRENTEIYNIMTMILAIGFVLITILRMGFIGVFLDNVIKYLTGNFSNVIYIMLLVICMARVLKIDIKHKYHIISILFLFTLILELIFFKSSNYSLFSYEYIKEYPHNFLGSGLIIKYVVQLFVYLISYIGLVILTITLLIMCILLYINAVYPNKLVELIITSTKDRKDEKSSNEIKENNVVTKEKNNILKDDNLEIDINEFEPVLETEKEIQSSIKKKSIDENIDNLSNNEKYENYSLPSLDLLSNPVENKTISKEDVLEKSKILQATFKNFGIEVKIVKAVVGPSITQFQILPTPGTKVSKITNLSSDIALNLAAKDIRIEAPIPGKSLIGIEIPNTDNQLVTLKEVFVNNDDSFPLSVSLGKNVSGESISARLDKMPHLLVAGSTGSGKSVCVNTIITSLLLKNRPDQVKMIMIDPKMVELSIYDGIPHLLTPVVTNPLKAADVLHKVVLEMERRYREFAIARVKNIEGYNKIARNDSEYEFLPYIVVIIDELADLMLVASKEVEESIARITQMARAAGIHLIIATQRPSVDVITGVIKSNIPSRIAFAVSSSIDSRTILDKSGAETLLGKGDMLFQSADSSKPVRLQGAFLSDQEVENIVDYIKNQAETEYDPNMQPSENSTKGDSLSTDDVDPLYHEVLLFIAKHQKASASLLQRRFKIGYNRAARIIETLEDDGYIGPADSSKPRKVFLEEEFAQNNE